MTVMHFLLACHELCTTEIPQQRKFTPCMCHSILKDEGIPSGCEEDLNALMAMVILQYAAHRLHLWEIPIMKQMNCFVFIMQFRRCA